MSRYFAIKITQELCSAIISADDYFCAPVSNASSFTMYPFPRKFSTPTFAIKQIKLQDLTSDQATLSQVDIHNTSNEHCEVYFQHGILQLTFDENVSADQTHSLCENIEAWAQSQSTRFTCHRDPDQSNQHKAVWRITAHPSAEPLYSFQTLTVDAVMRNTLQAKEHFIEKSNLFEKLAYQQYCAQQYQQCKAKVSANHAPLSTTRQWSQPRMIQIIKAILQERYTTETIQAHLLGQLYPFNAALRLCETTLREQYETDLNTTTIQPFEDWLQSTLTQWNKRITHSEQEASHWLHEQSTVHTIEIAHNAVAKLLDRIVTGSESADATLPASVAVTTQLQSDFITTLPDDKGTTTQPLLLIETAPLTHVGPRLHVRTSLCINADNVSLLPQFFAQIATLAQQQCHISMALKPASRPNESLIAITAAVPFLNTEYQQKVCLPGEAGLAQTARSNGKRTALFGVHEDFAIARNYELLTYCTQNNEFNYRKHRLSQIMQDIIKQIAAPGTDTPILTKKWWLFLDRPTPLHAPDK